MQVGCAEVQLKHQLRELYNNLAHSFCKKWMIEVEHPHVLGT